MSELRLVKDEYSGQVYCLVTLPDGRRGVLTQDIRRNALADGWVPLASEKGVPLDDLTITLPADPSDGRQFDQTLTQCTRDPAVLRTARRWVNLVDSLQPGEKLADYL